MKTKGIAQLQSLEPRRMMSGTPLSSGVHAFGDGQQLSIFGTRRNDSISLYFTGDAYLLKTGDGYRESFSGNYNSVRIVGGKGNDVIRIDGSVTVPAYVHGGDGNDVLSGGNGDDYLYGDNGIDKLYGNGGNDQIVTLGGGNRDLATGGEGNDAFWMDMASREKLVDPSANEWQAGSVNRVRGFQSSTATNGNSNQSVSTELLGQKINDPATTSSSYVYKSFNNNPLFSSSGPSMDDVKQGQIGDCYFLATLAGAADVSPETIRSMITDLGDGTYAVRFVDNSGAYKFYRVDNDLAVANANSGRPIYAGLGNENCMWVAVAEKAYTYHRRGAGTYESINGGWMSEVLTAVGATSQKTKWAQSSGGANAFMSWVEQQLNDGYIVTLGVLDYQSALNLVSGHAYTVESIETLEDGSKQLVIRNPWAIDGYTSIDGANDGYLKLSSQQAHAAIDVFVSGRAA